MSASERNSACRKRVIASSICGSAPGADADGSSPEAPVSDAVVPSSSPSADCSKTARTPRVIACCCGSASRPGRGALLVRGQRTHRRHGGGARDGLDHGAVDPLRPGGIEPLDGGGDGIAPHVTLPA
ncbi:hypothetical protein ABXN37_18025 [Piscinibacter sakaiensis]|uniref:hypothetical protein n=1 Tax=Piscinibacter sakaiensis TaxID=1547922 RepID=UPI003726D85F